MSVNAFWCPKCGGATATTRRWFSSTDGTAPSGMVRWFVCQARHCQFGFIDPYATNKVAKAARERWPAGGYGPAIAESPPKSLEAADGPQ